MRLFRSEALRAQDTLHGEVSLVPPVGWQLLGGFLLLAVAVAVAFAAVAPYAKVTVVRGEVAADKGVVRLAPPRAGVFDRLLVVEGQAVKAGQVLAHVSIGASEGGDSLQARRAQALERQASELSERLAGLEQGGRERVASLQAQIEGDERQVRSLREQIAEQAPLIRAAQDDLRDVRPLTEQGLLSQRDLRAREEQVATRRQGLSRLEQEVAARNSAVTVARAEIARTLADTRTQASQVQGARAELQRTAAGDDVVTGVDLKAPVDGVVTAVLIHAGDLATPASVAMTLVPSGARTEAVLAAPASAAGLLEPGQPVRIAVDAYPYQVFGSLQGAVTSVSRAATPAAPAAAAGGGDSFVVRAAMPPAISAYGAARALKPGMTLTARIRTRPRTLLAWMFDPVLAVARR